MDEGDKFGEGGRGLGVRIQHLSSFDKKLAPTCKDFSHVFDLLVVFELLYRIG